MQLIHDSLAGLALGAPQVHRNLALFPLLDAAGGVAPDYLLLDEALEKNLARVTEVSQAGSVPELAFENTAAEPILLVDGDELVGAKQNRILNLSVLVAGGRKIDIPVSCVEQGRWAWRSKAFGSAKRTLFASAKAKKYVHVSESLRRRGRRDADQNVLWQDVAQKVESSRADSPTMAMGDAYESRDGGLGDYAAAFRPEPRQRGAVIAVDGRVAGLELFDSPATFGKYLERLVRSWAMDAIETASATPLAPSLEDVRAFLEKMQQSATERFEALGEGEDIRLTGKGIAGGALAARGRVVHLAGFAVAP
jgi:hypothetical protein